MRFLPARKSGVKENQNQLLKLQNQILVANPAASLNI